MRDSLKKQKTESLAREIAVTNGHCYKEFFQIVGIWYAKRTSPVFFSREDNDLYRVFESFEDNAAQE